MGAGAGQGRQDLGEEGVELGLATYAVDERSERKIRSGAASAMSSALMSSAMFTTGTNAVQAFKSIPRRIVVTLLPLDRPNLSVSSSLL